MENQSKTPLNSAIEQSQRPAPQSIIPEGQFKFTPIEEMFETPEEINTKNVLADPDFYAGLNAAKPMIDKYGINAMASLGVAPSYSSDTFNPTDQEKPLDIYDVAGNMKAAMTLTPKSQAELPVSPTFSGARQTQFMRYYEHPEFDDLGYSPTSSMENYYNANSTIWDDFTRMRSQWWSVAAGGFASVYNSYGSLFSGNYLEPDLDGASAYADAMGIMSSSRDGALAFTNNLFANSAYTMGIIGSVAFEELLLAGATYLSGGSAAPVAVARTGFNIAKLGRAIYKIKDIGKYSRTILQQARNLDTARDFWNAAKSGGKVVANGLGNAFTPNSVAEIKSLKTAKNTGQNLSNMAKASVAFGGFYRDVQMVNLAMAEAKLESGMVYNDVMAQGMNDLSAQKGGKALTEEEVARIQRSADKAQFYTLMANAPLIYASNWFVLGTAFRGFKGAIAKSLGNTFASGVQKGIVNTAGKKAVDSAGKKILSPFKNAGRGWKGFTAKVKAGGWRGLAGSGALATLDYFAANVAEGVQEIGQEAISAATKGYFGEVIKDPTAGGEALQKEMMLSAMGSQFSEEGLEVFMSGFLMGGLVSLPQKAFFQGVPSIYNYGLFGMGTKAQKEAYAEHKANREEFINNLVKVYNEAWDSQAVDPTEMLDPNKMNFNIQKQVAENMKQNVYSKDLFGFIDQKDFAKFQQYYTIFAGGKASAFRNQIEAFQKLSDEELSEAFPELTKDEIKSGKARERMQDTLDRMDKAEKMFFEVEEKFPNPFDKKKFNRKTQPREYEQEAYRQAAYEHAKYLYMFTNSTFVRATERANDLFSRLESEPLFDGMAAKDLTVLLDVDSIDREITLLTAEIAATKGADQGIGETNKVKAEKIKRLQAFKKFVSDPKFTKKDGSFDRRRMNALRREFRNYVRYMASTSGAFVSEDAMNEALDMIVDYGALKGRQKTYYKALEYLGNPERIAEISDRQYQVNKELGDRRAELVREAAEKYTDIIEANELVNQLGKLGIYPDLVQVSAFLKTGNADYLTDFYDDYGYVDPKNNKARYDQIERLLNAYKETRREKQTEQAEKTEEDIASEAAEETRTALDQILDDAGLPPIDIDSSRITPMLDEILRNQYRKYAAQQALLDGEPLSPEEWNNSKQAKNIKATFIAMKKVWAAGPMTADPNGNVMYNKPVEKQFLETDEGFAEFLSSPDRLAQTPILTTILNQSDLTLNDFVELEDIDVTEGEAFQGNQAQTVYKEGQTANVIEYTIIDPQTDAVTKQYRILDKKGNELSKEQIEFLDSNYGSVFGTFLDASRAKEALVMGLDANVPDSAPFAFDGVTDLHQGMQVMKDGIKYVILSTPKQAAKGVLRIIDVTKKNGTKKEKDKATVKVYPGQFNGSYIPIVADFSLLSDNVSRIKSQDLFTMYPHVTYGGVTDLDERRAILAQAKESFNYIMTQLSPKQMESLELVVMLDPKGGTLTQDQLAVQDIAGNKYGESNPLIKRYRSKYYIGIRLGSEDLRQELLSNWPEDITPSISSDGVFGYINTDAYSIFDQETRQEIDPRNINSRQASNTVLPIKSNELTKDEKLEAVRKAFTLNALISQTFDSYDFTDGPLYFQNGTLPFTIALDVKGGRVAFDKKDKKLDALAYNTADDAGNIFVFNLRANPEVAGTRTLDYNTTAQGDERVKLFDDIIAGLELQNQANILSGPDRYVAIVKLPNGKYAKVNLKPTSLTEQERNALFVKVVDKAITVGKITDEAKATEEAYDFNNKTDIEDLFISSIPGNHIELKVGKDGSIFFSLDNKQLEETVNIGLTPEEVNSTDTQQEKLETLISRFNEDARVKAAKAVLKPKNFRRTFSNEAKVETIVENSTTQVDPKVITGQTIIVGASSEALQSAGNVPFIPRSKRQKVESQEEVENSKRPETAEEAEESVLDQSDAEFNDNLSNDFADNQESIDHLINKILRGEELSPREEEMMNNSVIANSVNFKVATLGGPGSMSTSTETPKKETKLDEVKRDIENLERELTEGLSGKEKYKALDESKEYQRLLKLRKSLESGANKLVGATTEVQRVEDYNEFLDWASANLPDNFSIEDLTTIADNGVNAGYQRVGAFVLNLNRIAGGITVDGVIYTSATSPFKYHEAFHGVFRMLLSQEDINKYRRIAKREVKAKYGNKYKETLERFRNSAEKYQGMTQEQLENEFAEEYMADEFEKFKMNPKSSKTDADVKNLFTRIIEFIKAVFSRYTTNELQTLFENIDSGKYRDANPQTNEFTTLDDSLSGNMSIANALIRYDSKQETRTGNDVGYLYLDTDIADTIVRSMAAMFVKQVQDLKLLGEDQFSPQSMMDDLLLEFRLLYDTSSIHNAGIQGPKREVLQTIEDAFKTYPEDIKKEVLALVNIIADMPANKELRIEDTEDTLGLRSVSEFDKEASMIGGFNSLSFKLRSYIATTTMAETDYFGNKTLVNGQELIVPVKFNEVYNGLLKAVKNTESHVDMLKRAYSFSRLNPQMKAVVDRLLNDVGVTPEELSSDAPLANIKDGALLQSILKGFQNSRLDYIFVERDSSGGILIYKATDRDNVNSQLDQWSQAYINRRKLYTSDENRKIRLVDLVKSIQEDMDSDTGSFVDMQAKANNYTQRLFDLTGLRISPLYMLYTLGQTIPAANRDPQTQILIDGFSEQSPMSYTLLTELNQAFQQNRNIFSKTQEGLSSRLATLAVQNAAFDESVGATSFVNPNNDLVFAHQLPTLHTRAIQSLNNEETIKNLEADDFLKNNYLLNNEAFRNLSKEQKLQVIRLAGSKIKDKILEDGSETNEDLLNSSLKPNKATQAFGEFTPQEFALELINLYTAEFNTRSGVVSSVEGLGKTQVGLSPTFIRVMEASNTGDLVTLPIIKAVTMKGDKVDLTPQLINVFYSSIENEYLRIAREARRLSVFQSTGVDPEGLSNIQGYNDSKEGRAFSFFNNGNVFDGATQDALVEEAFRSVESDNPALTLNQALKGAGKTPASVRADIKRNLKEAFKDFDAMLNEMQIKDLLSEQVKSGLTIAQGVQRSEVTISEARLNLNSNMNHNLQQIFFNNWVNSRSINELILGDQAVSLKGMVDKVKRAKLNNAAYYSAYSEVTDNNLGIFHPSKSFNMFAFSEPQASSTITGNSIDRADAQAYITAKGSRYTMFGFGRLSPAMAAMYDTIDVGNEVTGDRIFGQNTESYSLAKNQDLINSKKYVYMDGQTAVKMSVTVLTKEYTSTQQDGVWVPKPNMEELHYLREQMEQAEVDSKTFSMAAPESALKMMKQNVNALTPESTFDTNSDLEYTTLSTQFLGLQVINPSNKLVITDPSQIKSLITSEHLLEDENGKEIEVTIFGQSLPISKVIDAYNTAVSERVMLNYKNKRNLVFTFDAAQDEFSLSKAKGSITPNLAAFLDYAVAGLKASGASSNLLEFFSTEDGQQKYNLNNPITAAKFQQLFLTYFSRGVFRESSPGLSLSLVSDFGHKVYRRVYEVEIVDGVTIPVRSEVIRERNWKGTKDDLTDLQELTSNNIPSEGIVVLDDLRVGVMEYTDPKDPSTATGQRYSESITSPHNSEVLGLIANSDRAIPDVVAKMFAVRIPSQDKHSAMATKIVDFLPAYYGSSAMFPKELVEISGADFDIDKVYAVTKEYYVKDGEFIEYTDSYEDYVRYVNNKVNETGNTLSEAARLYKDDVLAAKLDNSITETELNIVTDKEAGDKRISEDGWKAMLTLGLPITEAQYNDYVKNNGVPFEAPLNNRVVDTRYALVSHAGMTELVKDKTADDKRNTPIAYQAADLEVLETALSDLVEMEGVQLFKDRANEGQQDVDNFTGMVRSFEANKGAAIGPIVKINQNLNLLTEYKIALNRPISIDGKPYQSYSVDYIGNDRKQDIVSALITAMTDNAKERLARKLGLNPSSIGAVGNMIALGIPLETSLMLINQAEIRDIYTQAFNKKDKFEPGVNKLLNRKIARLLNSLEESEKKKPVRLTKELFAKGIDSADNQTDREKLQVLSLFKRINDISSFTNNLTKVTSLTQGMPNSVPDLRQSRVQLQDLFSPNAPMDLTPLLKKGNSFFKTYLQIYTQISDDLLPATLLTVSPGFNSIINNVYEQLDTDQASFDFETMSNVEMDVLSYLTIKAYQKYHTESSSLAAPLTNDLIYPGPADQSDLSIVKIINDLRNQVQEDNFFLDSFVGVQSAFEEGNNTKLNLALADTWRRLNASSKIDLQTSFAKLYGNLDTRAGALSIIHYMMVKDGLQLKYASLLQAVSPFVINRYLSVINNVEDTLRNDSGFESTFGMTKDELIDELVEGYSTSNVNGPKLNTFEIDAGLPEGMKYSRINKEVTIDPAILDIEQDYIRIGETQGTRKFYRIFKKGEDNVYNEVPSMGANQQYGGGFAFGPRLEYEQLRNLKMTADEVADQPVPNQTPEQTNMTEAMRSPGAIITATEKSVEIQNNIEDAPVPISDTEKMLADLSANQISIKFDETENAVMEDVDMAMPEQTEEQQIESDNLKKDLDESQTMAETPELDTWWDANVENNSEAKAKLAKEGIRSLDDARNFLESDLFSGTEEGERNLIERLKCLI